MYLSFCGSGFLGIYHLGVAEALVSHGTKLLAKVVGYSGASSGALIAAWLTVKEPNSQNIQVCKDFCFNIAEKSRKKSLGILSPSYDLLGDVEKFLHEIVPPDAHRTATGKLHISLTKVKDKKCHIVSHFSSNEHLLQCLLASCYIPRVTGKEIIHINEEEYIDGGFTDNLPTMFTDHVTVSPFCGQQNICPEDESRFNMNLVYAKQAFKVSVKNMVRGGHALFPPNKDGMQRYHSQGFQDAIRFLKREGFYT